MESQESVANGTENPSEAESTTTKHDPLDTAQNSVRTPTSREFLRDSLRKRLLAEDLTIDDTVPVQPSEMAVQDSSSVPSQVTCESEKHAEAHSDGMVRLELQSNTEIEPRDRPPAPENGPAEGDSVRPRPAGKRNGPSMVPKGVVSKKPIFDKVPSSTVGPRMYVSQNRTWQAVAGHSIDLQKVPGMQFVLLSIIAAKGANGILQPELTKLSGQDKRSVPGRTDELAQAGYIEKKPVQAGTVRTSLLVHKRFVREGHFLKGSDNIEDVFRSRTVILTGFVGLLYKLFQDEDTDFIQMRDLRKKLVRPKEVSGGLELTAW